MHQTINFSSFCDAFKNMGRENHFSYEGLRAIFDYFEDLESSTGENVELDVMALCWDFSEIDDDDEEYSRYVGDSADLEDDVIALFDGFVLVSI